MAAIVTLPAISIVQGKQFLIEYVFEDMDGPIDLTEWQIEALLSKKPFDPAFWRAPISAGSDGRISLTIPAEETRNFPAQPILRGAPSAFFQITLSENSGDFDQVWQGSAIIAGVFP